MSLRSTLQDHPKALIWAWQLTEKVLLSSRGLFERLGYERASGLLRPGEDLLKSALFDCQMCGQCVLHYTGMTCPMTCPKNLRNGPCGGVRRDGHCEVDPDMMCVWVEAYERSLHTPYAAEINRLNPPVDWRLQDTASWVNFALGKDQIGISGFVEPEYGTQALSS